MKHIPLSYSRISDYVECPRKFHSKYIAKNYPDDSDNPAFIKGNQIHKDLEVAGKSLVAGIKPTVEMREESKLALPLLKKLVSSMNRVLFEQQIAVSSDMKRTEWFNNKTTKYRVIADMLGFAGETATLIDWKSGKVRDYDDKPTGQLHLSAGVILHLFPPIKEITTAYVFVEHKQVIKRKFHSEDKETLMKPFNELYDVICTDNEWEPKQNPHCRWCKVVGCEFNQ